MRKSMMALALAGLANGAAAQNISTDLIVELSFADTFLGIGESTTATITASWNGAAGSYLSSINIDLLASNNTGFVVSNVAPIAWNNVALGFSGTPDSIDGASIIGLQGSQFSLIPPHDASNPILVTTFTVTRIGEGSLTYSVQNAAGAPFPFSVTGPVFSDPVVQFGTDSFVSGTILPAPGTVGLLGLAGLVAGRRRR